MNFRKFTVFSGLAAAILLAAVSIFPQATRPNFNRVSNFDVQHYLIRASFDPAARKVFGDTTVTFKPLKDAFSEITLDAVNLSFDSVTLEPAGSRLKYRTAAGKVIIALDKPYNATDNVSIRLKYTATPKKGVYFVSENSSASTVPHSAQIWSQGEAEEARHWIPSFDFPSDKATTEEYITANKDETVIGNGVLVEKLDESNGKVTWHYKMDIPHSTYLISFVIGKFLRLEDKYGEIPLSFYTYPTKEKSGMNAFSRTKEMIRIFEEMTGVPFPYNKYDQTIVAGFQFGGMENITATTYADTEVFFGDFEFGKSTVVDLVSHELAHSWFGDMVTCRNWAELWLNEGFATYMEAVYREKAIGRSNYMLKIASDTDQFMIDNETTRSRHGLFNLRAGNPDSLFDSSAVTYNKGGVVLHMLRETIGDEAFWKGINLYLNRNKFGNVESSDLRKAVEESSGSDLQWFFDQWVYKSGAPQVEIRQTYSRQTKTLKLVVSQTQVADALVPSVFRLPMELQIKTAAGTSTEKIDITKRIQTFSINVASKPIEVNIDPGQKIPLMKGKLKAMVVI